MVVDQAQRRGAFEVTFPGLCMNLASLLTAKQMSGRVHERNKQHATIDRYHFACGSMPSRLSSEGQSALVNLADAARGVGAGRQSVIPDRWMMESA